ncbi:SPOR domain-containing protein [Flavisphingomonas formosensis]|uniref:SPOR domain-containing protein n=1 Tax=Flavisphingomonas formosensis TaxID=861534 RepID=UPI0012FCA056|nr:SPOR domain-containing protein [Sphingomonas formosensis]
MKIRLTRPAALLAASLFTIAWSGALRAQDDTPAVPDDPVLDARAAEARADPAEALARYLRVLAARPRDLTALTGAGRAALDIGDGNAAIGFFARAEQVAPTDGKVKAGLASALVQIGQPRAALKLFDQAVSLGVPDASIAADRGLAWDLRGDPKRAQRDYALALSKGPNDETTRRMALSMAIGGDRTGAMTVLDPLLRKQDKAAWRARAFIYALTGDPQAASDTAKLLMPSNQAAAIAPFLSKIGTLKPAQKAMAVNFGQIPADAETDAKSRTQLASAQDVLSSASQFGGGLPPAPAASAASADRPDRALIPTGKPLGRTAEAADGDEGDATPSTQPVQPVQPIQPSRNARAQQQQQQRQASRPSQEFVIAPDVSRIGAAERPPAGATSVETKLADSTGRATSPTAASPKPPAPSVEMRLADAADRATAGPVAPASRPAVSPASALAAASAGARQAASSEPPATAMPVRADPMPVRQVYGPPADGSDTPGQRAPVPQTVPAPAAQATAMPPRATYGAPADPGTAKPAPRPAAPKPANLAAIDPVDLKPASAATRPVEKARAPDKTKSAARDEDGGKDKSATVKTRDEDCTPATAGRTAHSAHRRGAAPSAKCAAGDGKVREAEAKTDAKGKAAGKTAAEEECATAAKGRTHGRSARQSAKCLALAAKDDKSAKDAKDAKGKAGGKGASDKGDDASAKDGKSAGDRFWVQVASGSNKANLGKAWDQVKSKSRLLQGRTPSSTPWKGSNRILVGPFKTDEEAQDFVNKLAKQGVSGIQFTSRKGSTVEKISTK